MCLSKRPKRCVDAKHAAGVTNLQAEGRGEEGGRQHSCSSHVKIIGKCCVLLCVKYLFVFLSVT